MEAATPAAAGEPQQGSTLLIGAIRNSWNCFRLLGAEAWHQGHLHAQPNVCKCEPFVGAQASSKGNAYFRGRAGVHMQGGPRKARRTGTQQQQQRQRMDGDGDIAMGGGEGGDEGVQCARV